MMSQNKNGSDSRGLYTEWYQERWHLAMIMFIYCSKGEGEAYTYLLTYKPMCIILHPYQNLGLVSPVWIILGHITLNSLLYLHSFML